MVPRLVEETYDAICAVRKEERAQEAIMSRFPFLYSKIGLGASSINEAACLRSPPLVALTVLESGDLAAEKKDPSEPISFRRYECSVHSRYTPGGFEETEMVSQDRRILILWGCGFVCRAFFFSREGLLGV